MPEGSERIGGFCEVLCRRGQRSIFLDERQAISSVGDYLLVEVDGRTDIGRVVWKGGGGLPRDAAPERGHVIRQATQDDIEAYTLQQQKEVAALEVFKQKISEHQLPMKTVDVEYERDGSRITFFFTAPRRVDFRKLVRDLARIYHTRIELRQINPRQEAQRLGGYGVCGRPLCCASFIRRLQPVSAHSVRNQSLSPNLSRLVGSCGQLKCCLRYEMDQNGEEPGCTGCRPENTDSDGPPETRDSRSDP